MSASDAVPRFVSFLVLWLPLLAHAALLNQLLGHPSPYLALHGSDPVAWQEWNADTVARARRENKLLFVSVGYFACHWCHVMQRESYRDPQIASHLNRAFIPVKVDRELNAGLDSALQSFSEQLNGVAGWPLNAFVTPEGYPAYVVLYAPPDTLSTLLTRVEQRWSSDAAGVRQLARRAAPAPAPPLVSAPVDAARAARARAQFMLAVWQEADVVNGGFGTVAKFPMVPQLDALLEHQARHPDPKLAEFLRLTLDQMASQGLRDHVGGGFFRYTVDPGWETPHFEKMLYDNAQLAALYLRAARVLRRPDYETVAKGALDFIRTALRGDAGGLHSSTSALDAQGREGGVYLWEPEELRRHLSPPVYAAVHRVWQLDAPRPFAGGYLPAEARRPTPQERRLLDEAVRALRPLRQTRGLPKDEKEIAGLNGLALSAFSRAIGRDPVFRREADRIQGFLLTRLMRDGRLSKALARGKRLEGAELEDYAYVVQGLLDHADATANRRSRIVARTLARAAWGTYWSARGWRDEARPLLATVQPQAALADGALHSASDVLILATLRLQDSALEDRARAAAAWRLPAMERDPFSYPSRVRLVERLAAVTMRP
jgi:uncharacterized protein YyaL (SSP411 family)